MSAAAHLSEIFVSFQGEGGQAGRRHLFVRFGGCNVRCTYCDTPDALVRVPTCSVDYPDGTSERLTNPVSVERLAAIVRRCCAVDSEISMIALTGGEPMLQAAFLAEWLERYPPPVGCLLETSALVSRGLERLLPRLAVVSADVKLPSNSGLGERWREHRRFFEVCARALREDARAGRQHALDVYVKMPVDAATDPAEVRHGAALVGELLPAATLFMQPITDVGSGAWQLSATRALDLVHHARMRMVRTHFRPQLHKLAGMR